MNKKLVSIKDRIKAKIKDHPEYISYGVALISIAASVVYVSRSSHTCPESPEDPCVCCEAKQKVTIDDRAYDGLIISDKSMERLLKDPSAICYKFDDDHHYSFMHNGCTDDH